MREATERAIELMGGTRPAARELELTPGAVNYWKKIGRIPPGWVIAVEEAVKARVTRYQLRPDVFGEG